MAKYGKARGTSAAKSNLAPHELLAEQYRNTFGSGDGATVLADLEKRFGRRRSFVHGDPHATSFNDGQRDVYLMILNLMDRETPPSA